MTAQKSERLMNLTICLLVTRTFLPKDRIRQAVEAYAGMSDDAFDRMFDRDKEDLRLLGIPIEVGTLEKAFEDEVGYRIRRDVFELPEINLAADEAAVVGLAARVWQNARMASATSQGLRKLRAAGVGVDESALTVLEPQLATEEPAFDAVFEAVTGATPISFAYWRPGASSSSTRRLEPWGIVSWHGHWYVVGHDRDREAPRMFRVSRISGDVTPIGPPGSSVAPADLDLRALASSLAPPTPHASATVRIRDGAGEPLRRQALGITSADDGWSEVELPFASASSLAEELSSYGPDVVVVAPAEVRDAVLTRLRAVSGGEAA